MFVRPVISALLREEGPPDFLDGFLEAPAKRDPERASIVPARARMDAGVFKVQTAAWKGSSDLLGLARSNALVLIPQGAGELPAGEPVRFLSLE
jgi:molybdopterin biosynthesis enzyme